MGEEKLAIQILPLLEVNDDNDIALGTQVSKSGEHVFQQKESIIPDGHAVYLRDHQLEEVYSLSENAVSLTLNSQITQRFSIQIQAQLNVLEIEPVLTQFKVFCDKQNIHFRSVDFHQTANFILYDFNGKSNYG